MTVKTSFKKPRMTPDGEVKFADVASHRPAPPSWLTSAEAMLTDPTVSSLRPPRIPREGLEFVSSERPRVDSTPPTTVGTWLKDLDGMRKARPASVPAPGEVSDVLRGGEPAVRRVDTLIDDLNPRADEEAVQAIEAALAEVVAERQRQLMDAEEQLLELVSVIARRVIARELSLDPSLIRGVVTEGVLALAEQDHVVVKLGDFFGEVLEQVAAAAAQIGVEAEVIVDPALGPYGCRIETRWGSVNEAVEERLSNLLASISIYPPRR